MGFGKDNKGAIVKEKTTLALVGLVADDLVTVDSAVVLDMDLRILRSDITAVIRAGTATEGVGLILYMAEGVLAATTQEANIEQNGPLRRGDQIGEEVASRWVRRVGIVTTPIGSDTDGLFRNKYDGGLLDLTPRWTFQRARTGTEGGWNWSVYNSGATITTGATVDILATHYGVWVE